MIIIMIMFGFGSTKFVEEFFRRSHFPFKGSILWESLCIHLNLLHTFLSETEWSKILI